MATEPESIENKIDRAFNLLLNYVSIFLLGVVIGMIISGR